MDDLVVVVAPPHARAHSEPMAIAPDPELLERLSAKLDAVLARRPAWPGPVADSYLFGVLTGMFAEEAKTHGESCDGCEFCRFLSRCLTVVSLHHIHSPHLAKLDIWKQSS